MWRDLQRARRILVSTVIRALPTHAYPKLRRDSHVLQLVRDFHEAQKLIAAICHGGWSPISAGVYRGVEVTGSLGIKDDLINAGAIWRDAPVVVDRHFISSRRPDDLPAFAGAMVECLSQ